MSLTRRPARREIAPYVSVVRTNERSGAPGGYDAGRPMRRRCRAHKRGSKMRSRTFAPTATGSLPLTCPKLPPAVNLRLPQHYFNRPPASPPDQINNKSRATKSMA